MRTAAWTLALFLLLQAALEYGVPMTWIHDHRVDYEMIKPDMAAGLERAVARIAREVGNEDYLILLGDSVAYSGPAPAHQSIGAYLEEQSGGALKVYNLAQPGMRIGDVYAVLLLLEKHGVPLRRVALDLTYAELVTRTPDEPSAFWLRETFRRLDPDLFATLGEEQTWSVVPGGWQITLRKRLLGWLPLWRDRHLLRARAGFGPRWDPNRLKRWDEKENIRQLMQDPVYRRFVDPHPYDLTAANRQFVLLQRILDKVRGAGPLVFLPPVNQALLEADVANPGYQENLTRLREWFEAQPGVTYVDLEKLLDDSYFADHVHLLPEGYRLVAAELYRHLSGVAGGTR